MSPINRVVVTAADRAAATLRRRGAAAMEVREHELCEGLFYTGIKVSRSPVFTDMPCAFLHHDDTGNDRSIAFVC